MPYLDPVAENNTTPMQTIPLHSPLVSNNQLRMQPRICCMGYKRSVKRRQVQRCCHSRRHLLCHDRREYPDGLGYRLHARAITMECPDECQLEGFSSFHSRSRFADTMLSTDSRADKNEGFFASLSACVRLKCKLANVSIPMRRYHAQFVNIVIQIPSD